MSMVTTTNPLLQSKVHKSKLGTFYSIQPEPQSLNALHSLQQDLEIHEILSFSMSGHIFSNSALQIPTFLL